MAASAAASLRCCIAPTAPSIGSPPTLPCSIILTPSTTRRSRPRLNSAIFTSYSGPGFNSKEFLRRHGSQSQLCRKARSVDNISLDEQAKHFGLPMLSISGPSPPEDEEDIAVADETDRFIKHSDA